jgi:hypothetical protein
MDDMEKTKSLIHSEDDKIKLNVPHKKYTAEEHRTRWRNFAVVMMILNLLLLIIALTVVIVWQNDRNDREEVPHPEALCLPCQELSLHKDDDGANLQTFQETTGADGEKVCCANTQERLKQLVDLVSLRESGVDIAKCSRARYYQFVTLWSIDRAIMIIMLIFLVN